MGKKVNPLQAKPKTTRIYGIMNQSRSVPPMQADHRFKEKPPSVVEDIPVSGDFPAESVTLLDLSKEDDTSGALSAAKTVSGVRVGLWRDPNSYRNLLWKTKIEDFTSYTHIEFWMYSENASCASFSFELRGPWKEESFEPAYFRYDMVLNWHGWKHFEVPLSVLDAAFGGSMDHITHFGFHATNWEGNLYATEGSYIYLYRFELTRRESDYRPDESLVTKKVLQDLRESWRTVLVGNEIVNASSPLAEKNAVALGRHGAEQWKTMNKAPDAECLWEGNSNIHKGEQKGNHVQIHAEKLFYMARAWATPKSEYYHNDTLLSDIHYGLNWLWTNGYGDELIRIGPSGNWWQWRIGIPLALVKCILMISDTLDAKEIRRLLSAADYFSYYPGMTQANRVWISYVSILSALLQNDVPRLTESIRRMQAVFGYVTSGDGFYEDGSFIQHGNTPYIGGYGTCYLNQIVDFFFVFDGSPLAIPEKYKNMLFDQYFNSYAPFTYKGIMQKCVCGRSVLGNGLAVNNVTAMMKLSSLLSPAQKKELFASVRQSCTENKRFDEELRRSLPLVCVPYYDELMNTPPDNINFFARVYGAMDRVISYNDRYCATLAFASSRISRYESINGQNESGWYQGEGSLCVVTDDLFAYDGDYYRYADPYRFPGTTVSDTPRTADSVVFISPGTYAFGGGVDEGKAALAAAHISFVPFNFPWPCGFSCDLDTKKSWYFFEGGILCLTAGITCTDDQTVYTTVENRKCAENEVETYLSVNGEKVFLTECDMLISGATTVYHPSFGTYAFFSPTDITVRRKTGKVSFWEILVCHGKLPDDASLAYLALPKTQEADAVAFLQKQTVKVLQNTPSFMVAQDSASGVKAYTFFEAESTEGVSVSAPCTLITRKDGQKTVCTVSDPTHYERSLTLYFNGEHKLFSADKEVSAVCNNGETLISVNTNAALGKSIRFILQ